LSTSSLVNQMTVVFSPCKGAHLMSEQFHKEMADQTVAQRPYVGK
jgi:hypothetical protein